MSLKKELEEHRDEILKQIEEWANGSFFEVNGREYKISKLSHQFRVEVLSVYSQIEANLLQGNYGFMAQDEFKKIMKKIDDRVMFDDMQISKLPKHFEEYAEDYIDYVSLSMKVICYPFYKNKLSTG